VKMRGIPNEADNLVTEPNVNYDAEVEVRFSEDLAYGDVVPLLDALAATPIFTIRTRREAYSGPMGEGPDWILLISVVVGTGGAVFAKTFCEELAKDTYRAVRRAICDLGRRLRRRRPQDLRHQTPVAIEFGDLLIYLGTPLHIGAPEAEWTDEWLLGCLQRAQDIVDVDFDGSRKRPEHPSYEHDYRVK
jgi:hypothetical protein